MRPRGGRMHRTVGCNSMKWRSIGLVVVIGSQLQGQVPFPSWWKIPANAWMKDPGSSSGSLRDNSVVRRQRDAYFDGLIGHAAPLTLDNVASKVLGRGSFAGNRLEIPTVPDRRVLIAQFTSYRTIWTASKRSIYTEVTARVLDVFTADELRVGQDIVIAVPGGTVKDELGNALSFLTQPRQFFIQPGRTYLFVLGFKPFGDFYMLAKTWDLTNGVVEPNFAVSSRESRALIGLSRDEAARYLRSTLGVR